MILKSIGVDKGVITNTVICECGNIIKTESHHVVKCNKCGHTKYIEHLHFKSSGFQDGARLSNYSKHN